ncbi:MAG: nucleotidyl transferase AbiEii/AbiGii toxin family protein [Candidatus Liptonbacteria bacterium]|nr:nucleotidyl transferase AbiEii/AbiGii toxin family protein [Candidatus Liptonbacteria bacterium]
MLDRASLQQFIKRAQTSPLNVIREYCQHLFLSYLYQLPGSERLLFKGGTALRIIFHSPRYSEDLDFTGARIAQAEVEDLFIDTIANIERTGIPVRIEEGKNTTGGYLGIVYFRAYDQEIEIRVEISLRVGKLVTGTRKLIENEYVPAYSIVHLPQDLLMRGKLDALKARHKPRDFYDYLFMLSGNYPLAEERDSLVAVLKLLRETKIDFRSELKQFLPASHVMHLRDFKKLLAQKILSFLDEK